MPLPHYSATSKESPDFRQSFMEELKNLSNYNIGLDKATAALEQLQKSSKESLKMPMRMSFDMILQSGVVEMQLATAQAEVDKYQELANSSTQRLETMLSNVAKARLKSPEAYVTVEEHSSQHWTLYFLSGKYQVLRTDSATEIPSVIASRFRQAGGSAGIYIS